MNISKITQYYHLMEKVGNVFLMDMMGVDVLSEFEALESEEEKQEYTETILLSLTTLQKSTGYVLYKDRNTSVLTPDQIQLMDRLKANWDKTLTEVAFALSKTGIYPVGEVLAPPPVEMYISSEREDPQKIITVAVIEIAKKCISYHGLNFFCTHCLMMSYKYWGQYQASSKLSELDVLIKGFPKKEYSVSR